MPTVTVTARPRAAEPARRPRRRPGDGCDPRDVVVSFTAEGEVYRGGDRPVFRLSAVNTGGRTCVFDVGPKALEVRITSGSDRVWSSAHCVRGSGESLQKLRRGIPHIQTITWDRRRSADGCTGSRRKAGDGTYVATLRGKGVRTARQVFRLR